MTREELFPKSEFPLQITTHFLFAEWMVEVDYYYENPFLGDHKQNSGKEFRFFNRSGESILELTTICEYGNTYRKFQKTPGGIIELTDAGYSKLANLHLDIFEKFSAIAEVLAKTRWRPL